MMSKDTETEETLSSIMPKIRIMNTVDKLLELEEKGRELASSEKINTVSKMRDWIDDVYDVVSELSSYVIEPSVYSIIEEKLLYTTDIFVYDIIRPLPNAVVDTWRTIIYVYDAMGNLDKLVRKLLGEVSRDRDIPSDLKKEITDTVSNFYRELVRRIGVPGHPRSKHADVKSLEELSNFLLEFKDQIGDLIDKLYNELFPEFSKLFARIVYEYGLDELNSMLSSLCASVYDAVVRLRTFRVIDELDENCKKVFGTRCTWLYGRIEPYSLNAMVNDASATIHRIAEKLREVVEEEMEGLERIGRIVLRNTSRHLVELAKELSRMWEENNKNDLYDVEDYSSLVGYCSGDRCEFRVGSAKGHMTHVKTVDDKIRVEYYDLDRDVNRVMKKLLEDVAECTCRLREDGVECLCPKEKGKEVAKVLSLATSMDFRLTDPDDFWSRDDINECYEDIRNNPDKYEGLEYDEALEYCLCRKHIKRKKE